jgi:hypothetical protein
MPSTDVGFHRLAARSSAQHAVGTGGARSKLPAASMPQSKMRSAESFAIPKHFQ